MPDTGRSKARLIEDLRRARRVISQRKRAEKALRESEERFRATFEQAAVGIAQVALDGRWIRVNQRLGEIVGYTQDELLRLTFQNITHPDDLDADVAQHRRMLDGAIDTYSLEKRYIRKDRSVVWVNLTTGAVRDEGGAIKYFASVVEDITDRKRAEETLRESEEHHRSLFENMLEGYAHCRMLYDDDKPHDFIYLDVNKAFGELTGLKNVVGMRVSEVIPGIRESSPELFEIYGRVASTDRPERFETYLESLGIWLSIAVYSPRRDHFIAVFDNITGRKRTEEALRETNEYLDNLFNYANAPIIVWDPQFRITRFNRAFESLTGRKAADVIGESLEILFPPTLVASSMELIRKTLSGERWETVEIDILHVDGAIRTVLWNSATLFAADGTTPVATIAQGQDITERKQLEAQFRQAQKMEAVGQLAGGVAHDFNNLLTVVMASCDFLEEGLHGSELLLNDVRAIKEASESAAGLTRQLLAFSRRQVLEPRVLDPNALLRDSENMLTRLLGEDVAIRLELAPDAGFVRADPGQLEQVIVNLAVNARAAMPDGGTLTLATAGAELDAGFVRKHVGASVGPFVMLAVTDTGCGMDEATLAKVFEPFFTTKEKGKGTGLGLSTVYGIVKQSGGFIWVDSEPGQGTTFKIYLPLAAPDQQLWRPTISSDAARPRGDETILLVEDNESVRALAARALRNLGYRVLEADGLEEAKQTAASEETIHLLLTDVVMPGGSGRDVSAAVRASHSAAKVLYMSGYTDNAIVHHGVLDSSVAFLQKPFTPDSLGRRVREVLDRECAAT